MIKHNPNYEGSLPDYGSHPRAHSFPYTLICLMKTCGGVISKDEKAVHFYNHYENYESEYTGLSYHLECYLNSEISKNYTLVHNNNKKKIRIAAL